MKKIRQLIRKTLTCEPSPTERIKLYRSLMIETKRIETRLNAPIRKETFVNAIKFIKEKRQQEEELNDVLKRLDSGFDSNVFFYFEYEQMLFKILLDKVEPDEKKIEEVWDLTVGNKSEEEIEEGYEKIFCSK